MQCCLFQLTDSLLLVCSVIKSQQIMPSSLCSLSNTSENFLSALYFFSAAQVLLHQQTSESFKWPSHPLLLLATICSFHDSCSLPDLTALWEETSLLSPDKYLIIPCPERSITCKTRRYKDTICPIPVSTQQK